MADAILDLFREALRDEVAPLRQAVELLTETVRRAAAAATASAGGAGGPAGAPDADASPGDDSRRDFVTRQEIASRLAVHISTVDRWRASGELASHKLEGVVRIARLDADNFILRRRSRPKGGDPRP